MRATSLVLIGVSQIHVVLNILINRNYSYCNTMYKWINKRFCLSVCLSAEKFTQTKRQNLQQIVDGHQIEDKDTVQCWCLNLHTIINICS